MCGNQNRARICYQASVPPVNKPKTEIRKKRGREEVEEIPFKLRNVERTFKVRTKLSDADKEAPISFIREFEDVFAWGPEDMPGVDPEVAIHRLHVDSMFVPIKQRKRTFSDEKNMAILSEVETLLKAKAIRELQFPKWIANVVLVKKSNNK
ncbi:hypothetical protein LIER_07056 [Lithospermum erythrorhizon]|uniref:Reverse transcriptase n=2 Tax=Lithospermum erythrorhizon TaxID=34254 RepID=A0AAV3P810_LITER